MDASSVAKAISDADVEATRDAARGRVIAELERLYGHCSAMIGLTEEGNADVRYAELAVRILDRVIKLYRLEGRAVVSEPDDTDVATATSVTMSQIRAQITQLAERTQGPMLEPLGALPNSHRL